MFRLVCLFLGFVFLLGCVHKEAVQCFSNEMLDIKQIYPRVHIKDGIKRLTSIELSLPVQCDSQEYVLPVSISHAVALLELALPDDYIEAISKGPSTSSYKYSSYGFSLDEDLYNFFSDKWNLDEQNNICVNDSEYNSEDNACYFVIVDELVNKNKL